MGAKSRNRDSFGLYLPNAKDHKHTLAELIDRYIEEILQDAQERQLLWWKKQLGPYLLRDITPAFIIEKRSMLGKSMTRSDRAMSSSTCNRYVAALRHTFTIAQRDWEWASDNPARRVVKLKEPRGRICCLDNEELQKILEECKKSRSAYLYPIVLIAVSTGMRYREISHLSWKQINFSEAVIIVYKTKNNRPRRVPLHGEALETLKKHSKVRRIDTDLIFPSQRDSSKPTDIMQAWRKVLKQTGIEDFCFHDLRHTAASYFSMSGASARDLCEIFGWQTMQMAMRYAHLFDSHTGELVARMNEKFL